MLLQGEFPVGAVVGAKYESGAGKLGVDLG